MKTAELKAYLDAKVLEYNNSDFVSKDPISIPHSYHRKQDIEITAFWVSMLSWGLRKTIINKSKELFGLMGDSPYEFIVNHNEKDKSRFEHFKHRTFQYTDTLYFLDYLQRYYRENDSMENAFARHLTSESIHVGDAIRGFHDEFFDIDYAPHRTRKHVATPARGSTCKRINMFLRWMVRDGDAGVDFGIWNTLQPSQLLMPLDVHVDRVGRKLKLIKRKQRDFPTVLELTKALKKFDPQDPVKYDFALFGVGVMEN